MNNAKSVGTGMATTSNHREFSTFIPLKFVRRGGRSVVEPPENAAQAIKDFAKLPDTKLIEGLTRAFYWQRLIDDGIVRSGVEIARQEGLDQATVNECMRLTLLDPKIIDSILQGTHPKGLNLHWFTKHPIPVLWNEQHEKFQAIADK
jgi:hypothetical protein